MESFSYNGEWFKPFRKFTKSEREQPLSAVEGKLTRYSDEEFENQWNMADFYRKSHSDADLFWWHGRLILPSWDTFFFVNQWL
ncbi:MAG: hypothetical protein IJI57_04740 [Flexilinea sp.]|nr:hypothetical protein [Flexilinea sp.]